MERMGPGYSRCCGLSSELSSRKVQHLCVFMSIYAILNVLLMIAAGDQTVVESTRQTYEYGE